MHIYDINHIYIRYLSRRLTGMLPSRNDAEREVPASAVFGHKTASRLTYDSATRGNHEKMGLDSPLESENGAGYNTQEHATNDGILREAAKKLPRVRQVLKQELLPMPSRARSSLFGGLRSGVARRRCTPHAAARVGVSGSPSLPPLLVLLLCLRLLLLFL